jgi:hypothetical protein
MDRTLVNLLQLLVIGVVAFGLARGARHLVPSRDQVDTSPWSSTLSYVATAYGVVVGFSIIFLFGEFADARQAVGDEATAIGTAFEEARLFPEAGPGIQRALICYARAVPEYDWPALRERGGAPEVDIAFRDIVLALGEDDQPATGALHAAVATNLGVQVGNISTARETRLVAAETQLPTLLWVLLGGGGLFVVGLIFVVTLPARPDIQAALVAMSAVFTAVMILLVVTLGTPFAEGGGRITPQLIEEELEELERTAPEGTTGPCPVGADG